MFSLKTLLVSLLAINATAVLAAPACTTKYAGGVYNVVEGPHLNDVDSTYICTDGILRPVPMMVDGQFCPGDGFPIDSTGMPVATAEAVRDRFTADQRKQICDAVKGVNCNGMEPLNTVNRNVCTLRRNDRHDPILKVDAATADAMLNMLLSFGTGTGTVSLPAPTAASSTSSDTPGTTAFPSGPSDASKPFALTVGI
ncbi:hypothetical protein HDZ31DRAFT_35669 [Schizophyllum fasciatum]